jgi:cytochrome c biogenesis protein CcdA
MSAQDWPSSVAAAVGRTGKAKWLRVIVVTLVIALGLAFQLTVSRDAGASPTTEFEIDDANIANGPAAPLDWGALFARSPAGGATAPVVATPAASGFSAVAFGEDSMKRDALPAPCRDNASGDLTVLAGDGSDKNGDAPRWWPAPRRAR